MPSYSTISERILAVIDSHPPMSIENLHNCFSRYLIADINRIFHEEMNAEITNFSFTTEGVYYQVRFTLRSLNEPCTEFFYFDSFSSIPFNPLYPDSVRTYLEVYLADLLRTPRMIDTSSHYLIYALSSHLRNYLSSMGFTLHNTRLLSAIGWGDPRWLLRMGMSCEVGTMTITLPITLEPYIEYVREAVEEAYHFSQPVYQWPQTPSTQTITATHSQPVYRWSPTPSTHVGDYFTVRSNDDSATCKLTKSSDYTYTELQKDGLPF